MGVNVPQQPLDLLGPVSVQRIGTFGRVQRAQRADRQSEAREDDPFQIAASETGSDEFEKAKRLPFMQGIVRRMTCA